MSLSLIARDIYRNIVVSFESVKDKNQYMVPSIVGGCVVLAIAGLCFFYYSHIRGKEYAAQQVLSECIEEYLHAREGKADWATVEMMCKAGYEKFAATKTAVYFIPFRVDALLALEQPDLVVPLLGQVLERLGTLSPLYYLYKTKLALIKLDSLDPAVQQAGLQELKESADETKNLNRDQALYYLAQYYQANQQPDAAKALFAQLETLPTKNSEGKSPWALIAQEALGGLPEQQEKFSIPLQ